MENMQIVPACKQNVEAQHVEMMVPLYSHGCQRKLEKALSHLRGIYSVSVDRSQQKVTVWGICNKYDLLDTVRCKRRGARFWNQEEDHVDDDPVLTFHEDVPSQSRPEFSTLLTKAKSFNLARPLRWKIPLEKVFSRSNPL